MLKIGCHLSVSKGFYEMGKDAVSIDANTVQFFTRNPRGGVVKPINEEDIKKSSILYKKLYLLDFFIVIVIRFPNCVSYKKLICYFYVKKKFK